MKNVLVDSDILIDYLRGLDSARAFFSASGRDFLFYLSVVSLAEIYAGKDTKNANKLKEIEQFLSNFEISLITPAIAKLGGGLRRDCSTPFADSLIAATALEYSFTLATRNIKHFNSLPKLKLFKPYG
ncbi:MAG: type II toxin-antitoxin system VapC family toxin [Patescibacteria group bacterium]